MNIRFALFCGNSDTLLQDLPENSVDSIVIDPPYGLSSRKTSDFKYCMNQWTRGLEFTFNKSGYMGEHWDNWVPSPFMFERLLKILKPGGHLVCFSSTRTIGLMQMAIEYAGFEIRDTLMWLFGTGMPKGINLNNEELPPNRQDLRGWRTHLKPGYEPITLARKPFDNKNTFIENMVKWRLGGYHADLLLVGGSDNVPNNTLVSHSPFCGNSACVDNCPLRNINKQYSNDYNGNRNATDGMNVIEWSNLDKSLNSFGNDDYTPALYVAKTERSERDMGTELIEKKYSSSELVKRKAGSAGINNPMAGAGRTQNDVGNPHPTVKPIALMKWLIQLVTPSNGVVLDCFMGSGSTGCAAMICSENYKFIGIEIKPEFAKVAAARINYVTDKKETIPEVFDRIKPENVPFIEVGKMASLNKNREYQEEGMLTSVDTSNVKGGFAERINLSKLNLFVGKNGSGKTAITNAIELVLLGTASDIFGREEVAINSGLMQLSNNPNSLTVNGSFLYNEKEFDISWYCQKNGDKGYKKPDHVEPPVKCQNVAIDVRKTLKGSADTIKKAILFRFHETIKMSDVLYYIPVNHVEVWNDMCKSLFGTPAQILCDAGDLCSKRIRELNAEIKPLEFIIKEISAGLPSRRPVREEVYAKYEDNTGASINEGLLIALEKQRADIEDKINELNTEKKSVLAGMVTVGKYTIDSQKEGCLLCLSQMNDSMANNIVGVVTNNDKYLNHHSQLNELYGQLGSINNQIESISNNKFSSSIDIDVIARNEGYMARFELIDRFNAEIDDKKKALSVYKELQTGIDLGIKKLAEKVKSNIINKAQKYLLDGDKLDIEMTDTTVKIGFVRNGVLNVALSGAEWARLNIALSVALADTNFINIIIPEERAYDPDTLSAIMEKLADCPFQVFMSSPVVPAREVTGWSVVQTASLKPVERPTSSVQAPKAPSPTPQARAPKNAPNPAQAGLFRTP